MESIEQLKNAIVASGLLTAPDVEDGFVFGRARMAATDADVMVNIDSEFDDRVEIDTALLIASVRRVLAVPAARWHGIIDAVAKEIEDAVGDEDAEAVTFDSVDGLLDHLTAKD